MIMKIMVSLDKDDAESLCKKTYNYFKKTLENKLNDLSKKEIRLNKVLKEEGQYLGTVESFGKEL